VITPPSGSCEPGHQTSREHDIAHLELLLPAWRRKTRGKFRWAVTLAVLVAIRLQITLPDNLSLLSRFLLPGIEAVVLIALVADHYARPA